MWSIRVCLSRFKNSTLNVEHLKCLFRTFFVFFCSFFKFFPSTLNSCSIGVFTRYYSFLLFSCSLISFFRTRIFVYMPKYSNLCQLHMQMCQLSAFDMFYQANIRRFLPVYAFHERTFCVAVVVVVIQHMQIFYVLTSTLTGAWWR